MKIGLRTGQNPSNFSRFEGKFTSKSAQSPSKSGFLGNPPDLQNRAISKIRDGSPPDLFFLHTLCRILQNLDLGIQFSGTGVLILKTPPLRFEIFNSYRKSTIIYKKSWKVGRKVLLFTKNLSSEKPPKYPFLTHSPLWNRPKIAIFFACGAFPPCIHPIFSARFARLLINLPL